MQKKLSRVAFDVSCTRIAQVHSRIRRFFTPIRVPPVR